MYLATIDLIKACWKKLDGSYYFGLHGSVTYVWFIWSFTGIEILITSQVQRKSAIWFRSSLVEI